MNNQKAKYYSSYLGHQKKVTFVGGISERRPKSDSFVNIRLFRIRGPISTWKGRREGGRGVLNEEARVAASCQKIKSGHKVNEPRRAFLFVFLLMI